MKILFVLRKRSFFSYQSSTLEALLRLGYQIDLLVTESEREAESREEDTAISRLINKYPGQLSFRLWWPIKENARQWLAHTTRTLHTLSNYLNHSKNQHYVKRWENQLGDRLQKLVRIPIIRFGLRRPECHWLFQWVESLLPSLKEVDDLLSQENYDIVVATPANLAFSREIEFVKAAKKRKTKCLVAVHSWDNLTTKGLFSVTPHRLLVWNEAQRTQAIGKHKFEDSAIEVVGCPFLDKWINFESTKEEERAFYERSGLDPQKPFLTYLGSTRTIAHDESRLIEQLAQALKTSTDANIRKLQLLFRPHPSNSHHYERLRNQGVYLLPEVKGLSCERESMSDFFCSLKLPVATVGVNTSAMIDAIVVGAPSVALVQPEFELTQKQTQHFNDMVSTGAVYLAKSVPACLQYLSQLFQGSADAQLKRSRLEFISTFIRPLGPRPAGEFAAQRITNLVSA